MTLPEGWVETTIGDVIQPIEGAEPSSNPHESFLYIDIGSIDNSCNVIREPKKMLGAAAPSRARRRIQTGDVLFATVRPYLKNIAQVPSELDGEVTSTGICVLRPANGMESGYLFRRVLSNDFIDAMTLASDGTMYPAIADSDVHSGGIAVPPASEQRRIVAKLDVLTARLSRARAELNRVEELAQRLRLFAVVRLWASTERQTLAGLLAEPIRNGLSVAGSDQPPGQPALRLSALRGTIVNLSDVRYIPIAPDRAKKYRIEAGDILVSRGNGTLSLVGKASRVGEATGEYPIFPDTAFRLRPDPALISSEWLLRVWNSPEVRRQIEGVARTTAGIWKISQRDLAQIQIPIASLEDQRRMAAAIGTAFARADRLEAEAARARGLLDRLEAAILAKAFRGALVPQDPNDEPASVLLNRIRAERAAAPKPKRGRARKAVG